MLEETSKIENNSLLRHVIVPPLFSLLLLQRRRRLSSSGTCHSTEQIVTGHPQLSGIDTREYLGIDTQEYDEKRGRDCGGRSRPTVLVAHQDVRIGLGLTGRFGSGA